MSKRKIREILFSQAVCGFAILTLVLGMALTSCDPGDPGGGDPGTEDTGGNGDGTGTDGTGGDGTGGTGTGGTGGTGTGGTGTGGTGGTDTGGTGTTSKPGTPTGFDAYQDGETTVELSWNAVSGATSYKVYYGSAGTSNPVLNWTTSSTSYTDTRTYKSVGETYYYKVSAVNSAGEGTASQVVSVQIAAAPSAPTGLTATALSSSSISVSWSQVSGVNGYVIYRSSSASGTYSYAGISETNSYTASGLSASTTYYFKVFAVNGAGTSDKSSSYASATTPASGGGGGSDNGSVKIVNNSGRTIKNLTFYQYGYDLIGGTGFYLFSTTISAGSNDTWTSAPAGSYVKIGSETYSGYKVNRPTSFTVTAGQTTTVTISSSDVVSN